uniref:Uncharacterized protein n=1 Tax=Romanomermis culicivorax TaxID=13658 RepID=A0A915JLG3_ROMCU
MATDEKFSNYCPEDTHYEANPSRGRDVKISKGIHPDYTVKEKGKNVDGYDTLSEDEVQRSSVQKADSSKENEKGHRPGKS